MNLGRVNLGDWLSVPLQCEDANGDPATPTAAPTLTIYDAAGVAVTGYDTVTMPPRDKDNVPSLFARDVRLDSNFSAGFYSGLLEWTAGAHTGAKQFWFQVVGGGHASGAYLAIHHYRRPHASYLVGQLDGGTLEFRRV